MEVRASRSHASISAQKIRLVCDKVRGMGAEQALTVLQFMPQKGAEIVHKLVSSALANAENNFELAREDLVVSQIFADGGPMLKRFKAGARGRYKPRKRRTAHVTVVLAEREESNNGS